MEGEEYENQEENDEEEIYVEGDIGKQINCVVKRVLQTLTVTEPIQRHSLFQICCTINKWVCDIIIDNKSCENVVSKSFVKILGLTIVKHLCPYKVRWIKKESEIIVNEVCTVAFSTGKILLRRSYL